MVTEGIKVVDEAPGVAAAAIRTVLRLVDALVGYAVAFVAGWHRGRRQRLDDTAAHTLMLRK
jgi:hypothetical protein